MIDRRAFLTRLLGATVAAAVAPSLDLLAASTPPVSVDALNGPVWSATFDTILREAHRLYCGHMADYGFPVRPEMCFSQELKLGETLAGGDLCDRLMSVTVPREELDRSVELAIRALAIRSAHVGVDRYGQLSLPPGVEYAGRCNPLRMIVAYSVIEDDVQVRFDVIGGVSPEARALATERNRIGQQNLTKRLIRQRLGGYLGSERLPA